MGAESAPVTRSVFSTRDVDRARDVLSATYGEQVPTLLGPLDRFILEISTTEFGPLGVDHVRYGSSVRTEYTPFDDTLVVGAVRGGGLSVDDGDRHRTPAPGDLVWFRPGRPAQTRSDDLVVDAVRLDVRALGQVASEMSGIAPEDLRIRAGTPVSAERARYWDATRRWVADHVLADGAVAVEPLVRAEAFRALARATLLAVPNTALERLADPSAPDPGWAEPATVRRAVEFMDANAGRDIDVAQIAEAARIGARGLQSAFRRHRGQTPLEYLRRVRMTGAHRDLESADPADGATVSAIAARWGFTHPGRFSVEYRRAYGHSPSHALRR